MVRNIITAIVLLCLAQTIPSSLKACSSFKFQRDGEFFYGHVLDEPGMRIPGVIYINKRGVFKTGRSFEEMFTNPPSAPYFEELVPRSKLCWISRFGSITASAWGRDFPDGGFNEAGLFIWEMSLVGTRYPVNDTLPKLMKMNWMQFVLDNCATLDEAIATTQSIEINGWQWHYFVGDGRGDCATIEFIDGKVVIHRGETLPIPALFNQTYERDMSYLPYFKGFGGTYEPDLDEFRVPRMVKTAVLLRDYDPARDNATDYAKELLWNVGNKPYKWGILIDVKRKKIYFRTDPAMEWKTFSYADIDFSNAGPVLTLQIDQEKGGDVLSRFHPQDDSEVEQVLLEFGLPDDFFSYFGITRQEFAKRFSTAYHEAENPERHYFVGTWKGELPGTNDKDEDRQFTLELKAEGSNVSGSVHFKGKDYPIAHINLIDKDLTFTFRADDHNIFIPKCHIDGNFLNVSLRRTEWFIGDFMMEKQ